MCDSVTGAGKEFSGRRSGSVTGAGKEFSGRRDDFPQPIQREESANKCEKRFRRLFQNGNALFSNGSAHRMNYSFRLSDNTAARIYSPLREFQVGNSERRMSNLETA